jgi:hypothetical protein
MKVNFVDCIVSILISIAFFLLDGLQCFLYLPHVLQDLQWSSTSRNNSDCSL